jgi:hypothetical protein
MRFQTVMDYGWVARQVRTSLGGGLGSIILDNMTPERL